MNPDVRVGRELHGVVLLPGSNLARLAFGERGPHGSGSLVRVCWRARERRRCGVHKR